MHDIYYDYFLLNKKLLKKLTAGCSISYKALETAAVVTAIIVSALSVYITVMFPCHTLIYIYVCVRSNQMIKITGALNISLLQM